MYIRQWLLEINILSSVRVVEVKRKVPKPKCATGSISHRYPEPPSMMRVWAPLWLVKTVTLAPRAKEPNWVRGMTRSQLLDEPWQQRWQVSLWRVRGMSWWKHTHLCDLEDRDWLLGALSMCQQQVQLSVPVQVCHSGTCPKHTESFHCADLHYNFTEALIWQLCRCKSRPYWQDAETSDIPNRAKLMKKICCPVSDLFLAPEALQHLLC